LPASPFIRRKGIQFYSLHQKKGGKKLLKSITVEKCKDEKMSEVDTASIAS